jgi:phosphohistidine phosphatase
MTRSVLVIRHGIAEEPVDAARQGRDDRRRELTQEGRQKMRQGARGLAKLQDGIDLLVSSPLVRAVQTADLVAEAFPKARRMEHPGLAPGVYPSALLKWVMEHKGTVALVAHEPDLSQWIGYMVSGEPRSLVEMKKGAVCKLEMPETAVPGEAQIAWHLTSRQLRELAAKG